MKTNQRRQAKTNWPEMLVWIRFNLMLDWTVIWSQGRGRTIFTFKSQFEVLRRFLEAFCYDWSSVVLTCRCVYVCWCDLQKYPMMKQDPTKLFGWQVEWIKLHGSKTNKSLVTRFLNSVASCTRMVSVIECNRTTIVVSPRKNRACLHFNARLCVHVEFDGCIFKFNIN